MFFSTNSLFVIPVCESLGVSRGQFTFHRTIITLTAAAIMPFYGRLLVRFGVKRTILFGSIAICGVIFSYSFANQLWHFYFLAFINGVFGVTINFMAIGVLVNEWFEDKKGLAMGIAYSGSGLGGAIMIPIISKVMERTDWRFAYQFMGVLGILILLPVIIFVLKDNPEKIGLKPYTLPSKGKRIIRENEKAKANLSLKEATRTHQFWLLVIAFFLISAFASATNTHSAPYFIDIGYPVGIVAIIIAVFMIFLTVGKIILGLMYDRFGTLAGNVFIVICCLIFPIAALLSHNPAFPWIYAVAIGLASCGFSIPVPILIAKYFGKKEYPMIFSLFTMIIIIGSSISVPLMGAVYDVRGSYRWAWIGLFICSVIIAVCIIGAEIIKPKKRHSP